MMVHLLSSLVNQTGTTTTNNPLNLAGAQRSCEVYSKESDNQYITNYRIIN